MTTEKKLDILKDADYIFREEIANAKLDRDLNQYFAVLTNLKSVGVIISNKTTSGNLLLYIIFFSLYGYGLYIS